METKLLTEHYHHEDYKTLEGYKKRGGYKTLEKAFSQNPRDIVEEVKKSGLRGRGRGRFSHRNQVGVFAGQWRAEVSPLQCG